MDRLKTLVASEDQRRIFVVGVLLILCLTIFFMKYISPESVSSDKDSCQLPRAGSGPALLFFNANQGCDCAMVVYRNADRQIVEWNPASRKEIPVFRLNIEQCHEAARQYKIILAPALLLLDQDGSIVYRQNFSISDESPLYLPTFETKINELINASPG